ncbi:Polymerase/histidinol phosphatase-like protein [Absidia repens]|uniref:Histidinol-phosphatase n=1 Tax=Absidia repens TaxID=90262 RepID=A0A1X2IUU7_9FUNG|nr:Polymerase/histidinol phosphatase-like protein [Absidia repens]
MPFSYHSHSGQFCHHGYGELEQVVQQAIKKEFKIYGLTEHMPRFDTTELYPEELEANCTPDTMITIFDDFVKEAHRLKVKYSNDIELLIGSEIEYIHPDYSSHVETLKKNWQLDYVVGSLHHVGGIPIDYSTELYQHALTTVAKGDYVSFFEAYYDEHWQMLQTVRPQVVGHFDLIRIFAPQDKDQPSSLTMALSTSTSPLWQKMERNIDLIISYGGLFEINSRAWKKMILAKGGKLTLSDDCHGPDDVGMHYNKLFDYMKELQINTIHYLTLENGQLVTKEADDILNDPFWSKVKSKDTL